MENQQKPRKSVLFSQNLIKDRGLIEQLVESSSLNPDDTVYEIGAGKGIITEVLASHCKNVVAIESDPQFVDQLKQRFAPQANVAIVQGNFLDYHLPKSSHKVFSNIPFNITSDIIRKLVNADTPPTDSYLITQYEAALKFAGNSYGKESLSSIQIKPWFELSIEYQFKKSDFTPEPNVKIVLLRIAKRQEPLISDDQSKVFKDFVAYVFNRSMPNIKVGLKHIFTGNQISRIAKDLRFSESTTPTQLTFEQWLDLFNSFLSLVDINKRQIVVGSDGKLKNEQARIEKYHRTRVSKNWKKEAMF